MREKEAEILQKEKIRKKFNKLDLTASLRL